MHPDLNPGEITSEKSLWDVYRLACRIRPNFLQLALNVIAASLLAINALVFVADSSLLLVDVRAWSTNGFNFAITTLGFLIAGFTIFTTVAKPDMMLAMMAHRDKETGLPTLKKNLFAFMRVFIAYLACAALYVCVLLFCQPNGLAGKVVLLLPRGACIKEVGIKIAYILIGTSFVYLLLMLKAFIFNIYAIVMNMLRWEYESQPKP